MQILLLQLDGKMPNIALMRIAREHRARGDTVRLRAAGNEQAIQRQLDEPTPDRVYASAIFSRTRQLADAVRQTWPGAKIGGTGVYPNGRLEEIGIATDGPLDYTDHPRWQPSIGFTQRGCRRRCPFCVVPTKEGAVRGARTIAQIWRGDPWPRHILLLDNDFFGNPAWPARVDELKAGRFRVCITQGINARMLNDETAAALASIDYRDNRMQVRRLYTALDHPGDTDRFLRGLRNLTDHGVRPHHILVYMLVGYWPDENQQARQQRLDAIREFGALPYPMPYVRTQELLGFQRWVIGGYDRSIGWEEWTAAEYRPSRLGRIKTGQLKLPE